MWHCWYCDMVAVNVVLMLVTEEVVAGVVALLVAVAW